MNPNCCRNSRPQFKHGDWHKEHAERLHLQFNRVETARETGKSVDAALYPFHYYWHGKSYRANPKIKVRLSLARLRNLYYHWRRNGRTPQAIALQYRPANRRPVTRAEIVRFVRLASAPETLTFASAFIAMQPDYSPTHFYSAMPAELSRALRALFKARRKQRDMEARFNRFLAKGGYNA